jgi:sulfate transport system permease protein
MSDAAIAGWRRPSILPGFAPTLGVTVVGLAGMVVIPLAAMVAMTFATGPGALLAALADARVLAAFRVSLACSLGAALLCAGLGLLLAWVLARYRFPGRRVLDAAIDLPFALPTAVAGITLAALYAPNGWIGGLLAPLGIRVAFTPLGILAALTFVDLPFVVRMVQPVLEAAEREAEEAAALLGASRFQIFRRVIMPGIAPALVTGFAMAFARGLGEYGSVIFIAGNKPMVSEIVPLLIVIQLEQFNYAGAAAIGTLMLLVSFALLFVINRLQAWSRARHGQ